LAGFEHMPLPGLQMPMSWQRSLAVHVIGFAPTQRPAWQESVWVHLSLSSQPAPLPLAGFEHAPVPASQVPATWHWSLAVQLLRFAPWHAPAWQLEVGVHLSLSSHEEPLGFGLAEQAPVVGLQTPMLQALSNAEQLTATPVTHCEFCRSQVSTPLHGLPSLHS
jgi:hypothetical protein